MTRNFATFVISLAAIVLAIPFVDRNDWQGWLATFVVIAASLWITGVRFYYAAMSLRERWAGRDLD